MNAYCKERICFGSREKDLVLGKNNYGLIKGLAPTDANPSQAKALVHWKLGFKCNNR
jgi:hypothetical protein